MPLLQDTLQSQVLTHVKEKLQFVTGENAGQRENLKLVEYDVCAPVIWTS